MPGITGMISNAHTHTVFCDGKNTAREMVLSAVEKRLASLGFTVHSPLGFEDDYSIKESDIPAYKNEICSLKEEFKNRIEIISGIEWDMDTEAVAGEYFDISDYEYAISAVHQIRDGDRYYSVDYTCAELKKCISDVFMGDSMAMVEEFYKRVVAAAERAPADIVAHFDLIAKLNGGNAIFDEDSVMYKEMWMDAIKRIKSMRPELLFEINTGGVFRGYRDYFYPRIDFLSKILECGFRIMINSDSHDISSIDFGYEDALRLAKDAGASEIFVLRGSRSGNGSLGGNNVSPLPGGKNTAFLERIKI